jgi:hypothetical protein
MFVIYPNNKLHFIDARSNVPKNKYTTISTESVLIVVYLFYGQMTVNGMFYNTEMELLWTNDRESLF